MSGNCCGVLSIEQGKYWHCAEWRNKDTQHYPEENTPILF